MENKKFIILFFSILSIVLTTGIIYLFSVFGGHGKNRNVIPDARILATTDKKIFDNKAQAYKALDKERQDRIREDNINVDLGKLFNSAGKKDTIREKSNLPGNTSQKPEPVINRRIQSQQHVRERDDKPTVKSSIPVEPEKSKVESTQVKNEATSGFGIYTASKKSNVNDSGRTKTAQGNFYPAYFDEDTKIKSGSPVVLILREDAIIEDIPVKKNATLYGYASDAGEYFDIRLTTVKNTDGNSYHLNSLIVYNEKYGRGITHVGKLDNSVKEGSSETANDISSTVTSSSPIGQVASKALSNTVRALTRHPQAEISIRQGYKVYVKSEE